jgi:uncharacterized membrane protein
MATMDHWLFGLTLVTAIGSGLMAGVFFAFSTFVMKALARLPAHEGIAAMQSINVAVINPMFLGAFLGTAVACAAEIVCVGVCWQRSGAAYLLAGAALYLVGTFFVTMRCNVPLNNSLAAISPSGPDAPSIGRTTSAGGRRGITCARSQRPRHLRRSPSRSVADAALATARNSRPTNRFLTA